jgi:hypothetical protein
LAKLCHQQEKQTQGREQKRHHKNGKKLANPPPPKPNSKIQAAPQGAKCTYGDQHPLARQKTAHGMDHGQRRDAIGQAADQLGLPRIPAKQAKQHKLYGQHGAPRDPGGQKSELKAIAKGSSQQLPRRAQPHQHKQNTQQNGNSLFHTDPPPFLFCLTDWITKTAKRYKEFARGGRIVLSPWKGTSDSS